MSSFGTCYTSGDPLGAFIEIFGELPVITQGEIDRRAFAQIELPPEPRWADMTDPKIVGWGLDERIGVGDDYDTCQRWSEAPFTVGFTGVMFRARHFVGSMCPSVAIFGNPGYQPTQLRVLDSTPIPHYLVADACSTFGLERWPSTPLGPPGSV